MNLLTEYSYTITNNWAVIYHWEVVYVKIPSWKLDVFFLNKSIFNE